MVRLFRKFAFLLIAACFTTVAAQEAATCSAIVDQALNTVTEACAPTGRNQSCYGNFSLDATPRADVQNFSFAKQGDLVNVADIENLQLKGLDTAKGIWGIALMRLQANLPDALPGQNVTFLLFGDVQVQNAVAPMPDLTTLDVTANSAINVRTGPGTDYRVAGTLASGQSATANGRNANGSWVRIQIPDSSAVGWVSTPLITPASDVSTLTVVEASAQEAPLKPMQAFYFKTGITGTNCTEAPPDGMLIQTPEGAGKVDLLANDVNIQLGSTVFMQANDDTMTISVIEGEIVVTATGKTVTVPAGAQVIIPISSLLHAIGDPGRVHPYNLTLVQYLPIRVLPRTITIAAPATAEQIAAAGTGGGSTTITQTNSSSSSSSSSSTSSSSTSSGSSSTVIYLLSQFGDFSGGTCAQLDEGLAKAGFSRGQFASLLRQYRPQFSPDQQALADRALQFVTSCG
ncbi:MAG: SH3 domain-containing protein [Chloroflexi bacterium]|nr:SH3 domain-containing protein [Chloroflexota bacterium]